MSEFIKRNFPAEFRAEKTDSDEYLGRITGVPIVYNEETDIGGIFSEVIMPGAISEETLANDVRLFCNHNIEEKALARSVIPLDKYGGMAFTVDEKCVKMDATINLKRTDAKDFFLAVEDGTIDTMSFMFAVAQERWERENTDYPKRIITKIEPVVEVSGVNFAAYKTTTIKAARADISAEIDMRVLENMRKAQRSAATDIDYKTKILIKLYGGKNK